MITHSKAPDTSCLEPLSLTSDEFRKKDVKTETHLSPAAYQRKQCGNFRRVSGLHKRNAHTLRGPNVCIKEAWRIGLRLNYCLMLREALFFI